MTFNFKRMKNKQGFLYETDDWEQIDSQVKRQVIAYDDTMMMVKVHFESGGVGSIHSHLHTQATYVAKGIFEVTIDGQTQVLKEGDSFFVASHLEHGLTCLEQGLLIDVFTPYRKDFIEKVSQ